MVGIAGVVLAMGLVLTGCGGSDGGDEVEATVGKAPVITRFVVGAMLSEVDNGVPEKTIFHPGDDFVYGFQATDEEGDWDKMVEVIRFGTQSRDASWDLSAEYAGAKSIGTNAGGYVGDTLGTFNMSWYIIDKGGNKSNVMERTITVETITVE
jgi:hypothetical protein